MASKAPVPRENTAREEKPTFHAVLNEFLRRNRVFFLVLFSAILAVLLAAAVWTVVDGRISAAATEAMEKAEASIREWTALEESPESRSKSDEILAELDAISSRFGKRYAAQKALMLAGRFYAEREDWASAERKFLEAAERKTDSFLAPFALQEAARAAEERDIETAVSLWKRFLENYPDSVGAPHALFVLGTLYEESKQFKEAADQYEKLASGHPDNDWTKLGRNRIILLKSQGLLP